MARPDVNDLIAFLAVARERSFTRAAARLGVSQSALSQTIRGLEERLGLRLLTRTTRSVAPTEAGERLLRAVGPRFDEIEAELAGLSELREKPAGTIRVTAGEHAAETILWPALSTLLPRYPDVKVELIVDYGLTDIVAERYDAGVRLGEQVAKDMIAIALVQTYAWQWLERLRTSKSGQCPRNRKTSPTMTASISACRLTADSSHGSSKSAGVS
jgi:DNA-binding transcriptional LysR family regulator